MGARVGVGVAVAVGVAVGESVAVGCGVGVSVGIAVGERVRVGSNVGVGMDVVSGVAHAASSSMLPIDNIRCSVFITVTSSMSNIIGPSVARRGKTAIFHANKRPRTKRTSLGKIPRLVESSLVSE